MEKMLYIFISGYYETYRDNIYRTLSLPTGMVNKYIFDYDARISPVINELNGRKNANVTKTEALIVFLDRSNDYNFYPVRKASYSLHVITDKEKKVAFYLKLGDYIYPRSAQATSTAIKGFPGVPKPGPGAPTDDGPYVSFQDSILPNDNPSSMFFFGDEAWKMAVCELNSMQAFRTAPGHTIEKNGQNGDSEKYYPIFFRVKCLEKQKKVDATPKDISPQYAESADAKKLTAFLQPRSGKTLLFKVECFFPTGGDIRSLKPKIVLTSKSEEVISTSISEDETTGEGPGGELEYTVTKEVQTLTIGIECWTSGDMRILCPNITIELRPKDMRTAKNIAIIFCAAIYLGSSALKTGSASASTIGWVTFLLQNWSSLVLDAVQLGMVIAITSLNDGKKLF